MRYALSFLLLALLIGRLSLDVQSVAAKVVLGWVAVSCLGLAAAFALSRPGVFMKRPGGKLSPLSYILFAPYHLANVALLYVMRLLGESPFDEIVPGLYLGGRLLPRDKGACFTSSSYAVLDLTSEFSECGYLCATPHYRCVPLLDAGAPTLEQLGDAAAWIAQQMQSRPVYVHCALGHGRSATFVAAYLLASARAQSAEQAICLIRSKRPKIRLSRAQKQVLARFEGMKANS